MAKTDSAKTTLKAQQRVTLTRDIRNVPEGTHGKVKVVQGLTWARYWVQFDNGEWIGSVSGSDLVREGDYEEFKKRRAEEASRPKVEAKAADASAADAGAPASAGGGRVPAHLIERSRAARERKSAAG